MTAITNELLDALLSPNDELRRSAESKLESLEATDRCHGFLLLLQGENGNQHKRMAAILLRHDILLLKNIDQLTILIEPLLIQFLSSPPESTKFVGDCIAEILSCMQWMNASSSSIALQKITNTIGSKVYQGDINSIRLLTRIAERAEKCFVTVVLPHLTSIVGNSLNVLQNNPINVVYLLELIVAATRITDIASFDTYSILPLIQYFSQQNPQAKWVVRVLEILVEAADEVPDLLVSNEDVFDATMGFCLQIIRQFSSDCSCQLSAIQIASSLLSNNKIKRSIHRNIAQRDILLQTDNSSFLGTCLSIICSSVDDDVQSWVNDPITLNEDGTEWDADADSTYAAMLLSQLLSCLGTSGVEAVLKIVGPALQASNTDWKAQRAALSIIQCCVEAVPVSFKSFVSSAVEAGLVLAYSSNPRVQYQAIMLLAVLCETLEVAETVKNTAAARLLETFARTAQVECSKISSIACVAIVSYCRPGGKSAENSDLWISPYLAEVLSAIVAGPFQVPWCRSGAVVVRTRAVGALACLAEASGGAFAPFYSSVMPRLIECALQPTNKNYELLQLSGTALEAITIIFQSIQDEHQHLFLEDAKSLLQWAMPYFSASDVAEDSIDMEQLLAACSRLASILGEDYAPFADPVISYVIRKISSTDEVEYHQGTVSELEYSGKIQPKLDEDTGIESMTVAIPGRGLTTVTVNTNQIQDKVKAAQSMYELAVALKSCFGPYSEICFQSFLPLVVYKFSASLRVASALTLSAVFDASCESCDSSVTRKYIVQLVTEISRQLEKDQNDEESLLGFSESLSDTFRTIYFLERDNQDQIMGSFSHDDLKAVVHIIMTSMVSCLERRKSTTMLLQNKNVFTDDDRHELNSHLQLEQNMLTQLVDSVGYILKATKEYFFPIFESEVLPVLSPYLQSEYDIRARLSAVCLFDDAVEHCGVEAANKYASHLVPAVILGFDDATNQGDLDLKSASIYGISQISRKTNGETLRPHAMSIIQELFSLTNMPKEESDNLILYENAMSCLASLILIGNAPFSATGFVKHETFLNRFLSSLPLREDVDEAKFCHSELCRLLETGQVNLITHCESLVRIIAETLVLVDDGEDIADMETCSRFADIVMYLNEQNTNGVGSIVASLPNECQVAVFAVLQNRINAPNLVTP